MSWRVRLFSFIVLVNSIAMSSCAPIPDKLEMTPKSITFTVKTLPRDAKVILDHGYIGLSPQNVSINYIEASHGYSKSETDKRILQIEKLGYKPRRFSFNIKDKGYLNIPKVINLQREKAKNVSVTGSVISLKKVTSTLLNETVLDLSPDNNWLLIQVNDQSSGNHILQKLNLESMIKISLTSNRYDSQSAVWHQSKDNLIYSSNRLGLNTLVQSLGTQGQVGAKFITTTDFGSADQPSLSLHYSDIAFTLSQNGEKSIALINEDGKELRVLGEGDSPDWHPSRSLIIYSRKLGNYSKLFSVDPLSGLNNTQLTEGEYNDIKPAWSPSGKHIAFLSNRSDGNYHIFIMSEDGSSITQITEGNFNVSSLIWGEENELFFSADAGETLNIWMLKLGV